MRPPIRLVLLLHVLFLALLPVTAAASDEPAAPEAPIRAALPDRRLFVGLNSSFVALQALDAISTLDATSGGAREANPLVAGLVGHPAAFIGVKAMSTATTVLLLKRLSREHPKAALITMAAINGVYAAIVANNLRHATGR